MSMEKKRMIRDRPSASRQEQLDVAQKERDQIHDEKLKAIERNTELTVRTSHLKIKLSSMRLNNTQKASNRKSWF